MTYSNIDNNSGENNDKNSSGSSSRDYYGSSLIF